VTMFRSQDLKNLVDNYGQSLTFTVKGAPTYDPTTGQVSSSDTDYTVMVYIHNYSLNEVNGDNIVLGDRRALFPTVDTSGNVIPEPEPGDEISGEGDTVRIVSVTTIMSGTSTICYQCQVRE